jgi:hypothetical protein
MTPEEFFNLPVGTQILNHGYDQCVALANTYHEDVLGLPLPSGFESAFQWWDDFAAQPNLTANYIQVTENPQHGDIFVGRYGLYQSANGHIGVVKENWDGSTFGTIEQNAGKNRYVDYYRRNHQNILGFLRPIQNIVPAKAKEKDMIFVVRTDDDGSCYVWNMSTDALQGIPNIGHLEILQRSLETWHFGNRGEFDAIRGWYKDTFSNGTTAQVAPVDTAALAQDIADKISNGATSVHETTKADIVSAIEANYPGDK